MRFTFFSLNRLSFSGGAEKYIIEVAKALKCRKNEVFYVGDCRPILSLNIFVEFFLGLLTFKKLIRELLDLNKYPSVIPESEKSISYVKLKLSAFLPFSYERKKIKEYLINSNLILVKNELLDMVIFFLLRLFKKNTKTALLIFSSLYYPSTTFRGKVHNFFYTGFLYKFLIKKYFFLIVSNKADIDFLNKTFEIDLSKIKYIPYGLDPQEFSLKINPRRSDIFKILFVGRLEEQKGVDVLVKIIDGLSNSNLFNRLEFTIIGDGPWMSQVISLAQKYPNVDYSGFLPRQKVKEAYLEHDLLLVPSRWETFSYVTLEAQFSGLPVVAFDIPGPRDIIQNRKTGVLVPVGNTEKFIQVIKSYVKKGVSADARKNIYDSSIKVFSLSETAAKLLTLAG